MGSHLVSFCSDRSSTSASATVIENVCQAQQHVGLERQYSLSPLIDPFAVEFSILQLLQHLGG
jgi:hypothetical protein